MSSEAEIDFAISPNFINAVKHRDGLKKQLLEGQSAQKLMGLSETAMMKFCSIAQELFKRGQYADSAKAFLFLATVSPQRYDYWIDLGEAREHCHDYEGAIDAYEIAALVDLENPVPFFHLAKCFFSIHDREASMQAINLAIDYSEDRGGLEDLHRQALAARILLLKEE